MCGEKLKCRGVGQCPGTFLQVQVDTVISLASMRHITIEIIAATRHAPQEIGLGLDPKPRWVLLTRIKATTF